MKTKNKVLTRRERDILILCEENKDCRHLDSDKIAQRLGITVSNLKIAVHRICTKLGAHSRNEAIMVALKNGEIGLMDILCTLDELAERLNFNSHGPDLLRMIAQFLRREIEYDYFVDNYNNYKEIRDNSEKEPAVLTQSERDVLILAGYGLTNKEIADRLYISISSVRTFIYRACAKLGVAKRADAVLLAKKKGEIYTSDLFSPDELIRMLTPLGAESIEELARLLEVQQTHGQERSPIPV